VKVKVSHGTLIALHLGAPSPGERARVGKHRGCRQLTAGQARVATALSPGTAPGPPAEHTFICAKLWRGLQLYSEISLTAYTVTHLKTLLQITHLNTFICAKLLLYSTVHLHPLYSYCIRVSRQYSSTHLKTFICAKLWRGLLNRNANVPGVAVRSPSFHRMAAKALLRRWLGRGTPRELWDQRSMRLQASLPLMERTLAPKRGRC